ncbi:MAG: triose-phosphate isomerase [Defluviitaleaceae bacterium]|nr:triose-phosphate isomerase [Defluviitaleaceae bacterium]MCL2263490.1 triose-phosphate isomerase [Defluviitaleaceae bacterium]
MARKKIVAGNWKMNLSPRKAEKFTKEMRSVINTDNVEVVMCVPFVYLTMVQEILDGTKIKIGAQNMHYADEGAYTGEISGKMLSRMKVPYVIVGHSERREYFAETDTTVNIKALKALSHGLIPIICIGETLKQREFERTFEVISKQLAIAIHDMSEEDIAKIVIAYEPIWAIGTGKTATKEQAEEVCAAIREQLRTQYGDIADSVRILYGGSVNEKNANELFNMPNIDGGLVGGASLKPSFEKVVHYQ